MSSISAADVYGHRCFSMIQKVAEFKGHVENLPSVEKGKDERLIKIESQLKVLESLQSEFLKNPTDEKLIAQIHAAEKDVREMQNVLFNILVPEVEGYDLSWVDETEDVEKMHFTSFVKDYPQLKKLLENYSLNTSVREEIIDRIDKYGEQAELLDPHLVEIVKLLLAPIVNILRNYEYKTEDLKNPDYVVNACFEILNKIICIRGYKTVVKLLPHEVHDLEPVLAALKAYTEISIDRSLWHAKYGLLLWLSIVMLIPFNLSTVDSQEDVGGGIVNRILDLCKLYIEKSGRTSQGSGFLLSRMFSRPDLQVSHMKNFFDYCVERIKAQRVSDELYNDMLEHAKGKKHVKVHRFNQGYSLQGVLSALAQIYKQAPREKLMELSPIIHPMLMEIVEDAESLTSKYCVKIIGRMGLAFLKPKVAKWRYQKGRITMLNKTEDKKEMEDKKQGVDSDEESDFEVPEEIETALDVLLDKLKEDESGVRWSAAKGIGRLTMRLPLDFADEVVQLIIEFLSPNEDDAAWHGACLCLAELARRGLLLPERLKTVIPLLQKAMLYDKFVGNYSKGSHVRDAACYVAWAFARAYEPEVMLPYVPDIAQGLLTMCVYDREVHCRRAASAAFQENVGRQRNFPHGIEIVTAADYFTVGVRSRAYLEISKFICQFEEYQEFLVNHLVNDKLQHWNQEIRELSAKTLHELTDLNPKYLRDIVVPILIPKTQSVVVVERHGALYGIAQILLKLQKLGVDVPPQLQKKLRNVVPKIEQAQLYRGRGGMGVKTGALFLIEAMATCKIEMSPKAVWRHFQTMEDALKYPHEDIQDQCISAFRVFVTLYLNTPEENLTNRIKMWCKSMINEENIASCRGFGRAMGCFSEEVLLNQIKLIVDTLIKRTRMPNKKEHYDYIGRKKCVEALAEIVETLGARDFPDYTWNESEDKGDEEEEEDSDDEMPEDLKQFLMETGQLTSKKKKKVDPFYWEFERDTNDSNMFYDRITSCLISRFYDYETDRRGDIGSFVRQETVVSLVKIVNILYTAGNKSDGSRWLRPAVSQRLISEAIKQMLEPLSRLRLTCVDEMEIIRKIPKLETNLCIQRETIEHLTDTLDIEIAWRDENAVLTQFAPLWLISEYRFYMLAAFCKSWCTVGTQKKGKMLESLDKILGNLARTGGEKARIDLCRGFANSFLQILQTPRLLRAIGYRVCVYRALSALMEREYFLSFAEDEDVFPELLTLILKSVPRAIKKDVRICASLIKLLLQMLRFPASRVKTLEAIVAMLVSGWGSVRKRLSEEFYTVLITFGDEIFDEETNSELQDALLMADWTGGASMTESAVEAQHSICDLLKLDSNNKFEEEDSD